MGEAFGWSRYPLHLPSGSNCEPNAAAELRRAPSRTTGSRPAVGARQPLRQLFQSQMRAERSFALPSPIPRRFQQDAVPGADSDAIEFSRQTWP